MILALGATRVKKIKNAGKPIKLMPSTMLDSGDRTSSKRGQDGRDARSRMSDGSAAISALSWQDVGDISASFASLNPYHPDKVPGSVLELEHENYEDANKTSRRQLYCYSISAKRYALYSLDNQGKPQLRPPERDSKDRLVRPGEKWSEHGLGHLLDPTANPDRDDDAPAWPRDVWQSIIDEHHTGTRPSVSFEVRPAIGRATAGRPRLLDAFEAYNHGRPYAEQVKPYNFLLSASVAPEDRPATPDGAFHLIAPFDSDPAAWEHTRWVDRYSRRTFEITTTKAATRGRIRVATIGEALDDYRVHPESKSTDATGAPCDQRTIGLLHRRPVTLRRLRYVGKESNDLEARITGTSQPADELETEYTDPTAAGMEARSLLATLAALGYGTGATADAIGVDRKTVQRWLAGTSEPSGQALTDLRQFTWSVVGDLARPKSSAGDSTS